MGIMRVNGVEIEVPDGASVSINNGAIFINGLPWEGQKLSGTTKLVVEGALISLRVDRGDVEVHGNIQGNVDSGGGVRVSGAVGGNIDAGGGVQCGNVTGSVDAGGGVQCGSVGGNVDAGGSVRMSRWG